MVFNQLLLYLRKKNQGGGKGSSPELRNTWGRTKIRRKGGTEGGGGGKGRETGEDWPFNGGWYMGGGPQERMLGANGLGRLCNASLVAL